MIMRVTGTDLWNSEKIVMLSQWLVLSFCIFPLISSESHSHQHLAVEKHLSNEQRFIISSISSTVTVKDSSAVQNNIPAVSSNDNSAIKNKTVAKLVEYDDSLPEQRAPSGIDHNFSVRDSGSHETWPGFLSPDSPIGRFPPKAPLIPDIFTVAVETVYLKVKVNQKVEYDFSCTKMYK